MSQETLSAPSPEAAPTPEANPDISHQVDAANREFLAEAIEAAKDRLAHNQQLDAQISNEVARAIGDAAKIRKANEVADESFIISAKVGDAIKPSVPLTLKVMRGRKYHEAKIDTSTKKAANYEKMKLQEKAKNKAYRKPNKAGVSTSRKQRKLASKELDARYKAHKHEQKKDYITRVVAGGPEIEWMDDESRQAKGYKDLVKDLGNIPNLIEGRQNVRHRLHEMQRQVQAGELAEDDATFMALLAEEASWRDESDEDYKERLKQEATEYYRDWLMDKEEKEDVAEYKKTEEELADRYEKTASLEKLKIENPAKYAELILEMSTWKPLDELVRDKYKHGANDFKRWVLTDSRKDLEKELRTSLTELDSKAEGLEKDINDLQQNRDTLFASYRAAESQGTLSAAEKGKYAEELNKADKEITKTKEALAALNAKVDENEEQLEAVQRWSPDVFEGLPSDIRRLWRDIVKTLDDRDPNQEVTTKFSRRIRNIESWEKR